MEGKTDLEKCSDLPRVALQEELRFGPQVASLPVPALDTPLPSTPAALHCASPALHFLLFPVHGDPYFLTSTPYPLTSLRALQLSSLILITSAFSAVAVQSPAFPPQPSSRAPFPHSQART